MPRQKGHSQEALWGNVERKALYEIPSEKVRRSFAKDEEKKRAAAAEKRNQEFWKGQKVRTQLALQKHMLRNSAPAPALAP
jgi:hypothetical protein